MTCATRRLFITGKERTNFVGVSGICCFCSGIKCGKCSKCSSFFLSSVEIGNGNKPDDGRAPRIKVVKYLKSTSKVRRVPIIIRYAYKVL